MPVPTLISELSQTAGSNSPAGSESPTSADDYLRTYASFIATLRDGKGFTNPVQLASGATTDIGGQNSMFVEITGTTTITSFSTNYNGPRFLRFTGILALTHNATTLNLPGAANITTAAGDTAIAIPNQAGNGWNVVNFQRAAALPATAGSNSDITALTGLVGPGLVPVGTVIHVAMSSAPTGYLKANGANVSRATYSALFTAIGTTFGAGDGSTTFTLPDLRAEFIRGLDDSRGVDTGRALGSAQADAFESHNHTIKRVPAGAGAGGTGNVIYADSSRDSSGFVDPFGDSSSPVNVTGDTETRPRNVALLACIKF